MPVIAVVGSQWGDEGKGKIVDLLAKKVRMTVRFSGGDNAGHTVINPLGEFRLHLIPSGVFSPNVTCIIGNGLVINPAILLKEMDELQRQGVDLSRLYVSDRAHVIMPYHTILDELEEKARGEGALGTTKRGVGPAFMDKIGRLGIRIGDLLDKEAFLARLKFVLDYKNAILTKVYQAEPLSLEEIYQQYREYGDRLAPFVKETEFLIEEALQRNDLILLEGAQGSLLDPDFGTYPYVTSSSPLAGGGSLGTGLGPTKMDFVLGVFKAYTTRVGGGPMPTELVDDTGKLIRERAHEYGTTTGRPRRCGWFDAIAGKLSVHINGLSGIALTRLDILDALPSLKICVGYKLNDQTITRFPSNIASLAKCEPIYEELAGWQSPTTDKRYFDDLPPQACNYIRRIEELLACSINIVSVGASREQAIIVKPIGNLWPG